MENPIFERKIKGLKSIHILLTVVTLFYGLILVFINSANSKFVSLANISSEGIQGIFFGSIIYLFLCAFLIPHYRKKWIASYKPLNPPKFDNKGRIIDYFAMYSARFFVGISIIQVGAILGMVIFFLGGNHMYAYACIALSIIVVALNGPKRDELLELREAEGLTNQSQQKQSKKLTKKQKLK